MGKQRIDYSAFDNAFDDVLTAEEKAEEKRRKEEEGDEPIIDYSAFDGAFGESQDPIESEEPLESDKKKEETSFQGLGGAGYSRTSKPKKPIKEAGQDADPVKQPFNPETATREDFDKTRDFMVFGKKKAGERAVKELSADKSYQESASAQVTKLFAELSPYFEQQKSENDDLLAAGSITQEAHANKLDQIEKSQLKDLQEWVAEDPKIRALQKQKAIDTQKLSNKYYEDFRNREREKNRSTFPGFIDKLVAPGSNVVTDFIGKNLSKGLESGSRQVVKELERRSDVTNKIIDIGRGYEMIQVGDIAPAGVGTGIQLERRELTDEDKIRMIDEVAETYATLDLIPDSEAMEELNKIVEKGGSFLGSSKEMLPLMLAKPHLFLELGGKSAGSAPEQMLLSIAGGLTGGAGFVIGSAIGTLSAEKANSFVQLVQAAEVDISDPEAMKKFFMDPNSRKKLEEIEENSTNRATAMAAIGVVFDVATLGLNRFVAPTAGRELLKKTGQFGLQMISEGTQELGGIKASGQEVNYAEVSLEVFAGLLGNTKDVLLANERTTYTYDGAPLNRKQTLEIVENNPTQEELGRLDVVNDIGMNKRIEKKKKEVDTAEAKKPAPAKEEVAPEVDAESIETTEEVEAEMDKIASEFETKEVAKAQDEEAIAKAIVPIEEGQAEVDQLTTTKEEPLSALGGNNEAVQELIDETKPIVEQAAKEVEPVEETKPVEEVQPVEPVEETQIIEEAKPEVVQEPAPVEEVVEPVIKEVKTIKKTIEPKGVKVEKKTAEDLGIRRNGEVGQFFQPSSYYIEGSNKAGLKLTSFTVEGMEKSISRLKAYDEILQNELISNTIEHLEQGLELYKLSQEKTTENNVEREQKIQEAKDKLKQSEKLIDVMVDGSKAVNTVTTAMLEQLKEFSFENNSSHALKQQVNKVADLLQELYPKGINIKDQLAVETSEKKLVKAKEKIKVLPSVAQKKIDKAKDKAKVMPSKVKKPKAKKAKATPAKKKEVFDKGNKKRAKRQSVNQKLQAAEPETTRQMILQKLISQKILSDDIRKETGFGSKRKGSNRGLRGKDDFEQRRWMHSTKGMTIDDLVGVIKEQWTSKFGEQEVDESEIRNEIIAAISEHSTKGEIKQALMDDFAVDGQIIEDGIERAERKNQEEQLKAFGNQLYEELSPEEAAFVESDDQTAQDVDQALEVTDEEGDILMQEENEYNNWLDLQPNEERREERKEGIASTSPVSQEGDTDSNEASSGEKGQKESLADSKKAEFDKAITEVDSEVETIAKEEGVKKAALLDTIKTEVNNLLADASHKVKGVSKKVLDLINKVYNKVILAMVAVGTAAMLSSFTYDNSAIGTVSSRPETDKNIEISKSQADERTDITASKQPPKKESKEAPASPAEAGAGALVLLAALRRKKKSGKLTDSEKATLGNLEKLSQRMTALEQGKAEVAKKAAAEAKAKKAADAKPKPVASEMPTTKKLEEAKARKNKAEKELKLNKAKFVPKKAARELFNIAKTLLSEGDKISKAAFKKGATEMRNFIKQNQKAVIRDIKNAVKEFGLKEINVSQATRILTKLSNLPTSEKASINAIRDIFNILEKANRANEIKEVKAKIKKIKKRKDKAKSIEQTVNNLTSIDPEMVPTKDWKAYRELVDELASTTRIISPEYVSHVAGFAKGHFAEWVNNLVDRIAQSAQDIEEQLADYKTILDDLKLEDPEISQDDAINEILDKMNIYVQDDAEMHAALIKKHWARVNKKAVDVVEESEKAEAKAAQKAEERAETIDSILSNSKTLILGDDFNKDELLLVNDLRNLTEDDIQDFDDTQLNNLDKVIHNLHFEYISSFANSLRNKVVARRNLNSLVNKVDVLVEQSKFKMNPEFGRADIVLEADKLVKQLEKAHAQNIEQFIGRVKDHDIYTRLVAPVLNRMEQAHNESNTEHSVLKNLFDRIKTDRKGLNRLNVIMNMIMTQDEFDSNPDNKKVGSVKAHMEAMDEGSDVSPKTIAHYKKIFDSVKNTETGELDLLKARAELSKHKLRKRGLDERLIKISKKEGIDNAEDILDHMRDRLDNVYNAQAKFVKNTIDDKAFTEMVNYFPRKSLSNTASLADQTIISKVQGNKGASFKSGNLEERMNKVGEIEFNAFGNFLGATKGVNLQYHLQQALNETNATLGLMSQKGDQNTKQVAKALREYMATTVELDLQSYDKLGAKNHPVWTHVWNKLLSRQSVNTLASFRRLGAEILSNLLGRLWKSGKAPKFISSSTSKLTGKFIEIFGSAQTTRQGHVSDEMQHQSSIKAKNIERYEQQDAGSKIYSKLFENRIMQFLPEAISRFNKKLVTLGDTAMLNAAWHSDVHEAFKEITRKPLDMERAMTDSQYRAKNERDIKRAVSIADKETSLTLNIGGSTHQSVDAKRAKRTLLGAAGRFMRGFSANESMIVRDAFMSLRGKGGTMTKKKAAMVLMGTMTQQAAYTAIRQSIGIVIANTFSGKDYEDLDEEGKKILGSITLDLLLTNTIGHKSAYASAALTWLGVSVLDYALAKEDKDILDNIFAPDPSYSPSLMRQFGAPGGIASDVYSLGTEVLKKDTEWSKVALLIAKHSAGVPAYQDVNLVQRELTPTKKKSRRRKSPFSDAINFTDEFKDDFTDGFSNKFDF
jgi:hypothetical protein